MTDLTRERLQEILNAWATKKSWPNYDEMQPMIEMTMRHLDAQPIEAGAIRNATLEECAELAQAVKHEDRNVQGCLDFLATAYRALKFSLAKPPDGWQLVPKEPTKEMIENVLPWLQKSADGHMAYSEIYKAMLAAAPLKDKT